MKGPLISRFAGSASLNLEAVRRMGARAGCRLLLVAACTALSNAAFAQPFSPTFSPKGIMAVIRNEPGQPLDLIPFQRDYVRGIAYQVRWQDIEPTQGNPDWTQLDHLFAQAQASHKWVQLLVFAGFFSPSWALVGAQTDTFTIQYGPGSPAMALLPMPWDPVYRSNWYQFVHLLAARYAGNPALKMIAASGPTSVSVEATLPDAPPEVKRWIADGYTSTKYLAAWQEAFNEFGNAFPLQYISLAHGDGLPVNALGEIDDTQVIATSLAEEATGFSLLKGRFVFQSSALTGQPKFLETPAYHQVMTYAGHAWTGFQDATSCLTGFVQMGGATPALAMQNAFDNASTQNFFAPRVNYWQVQAEDVDTPDQKIQAILEQAAFYFNPPSGNP